MREVILIELDALLDTRLGTISLMDEALARKMLDTDYPNRISDEFNLLCPEIDMSIYKRAYKDRDLETLYYSMPTDITLYLNQLINTLIRDGVKGNPQFEGVDVQINSYPYQLTDEFKQEFCECIAASLRLDIDVQMVNHPYSEMTTDFIVANKWTFLVMYNFSQWFNETLAIAKTVPRPTPRTTVISPMLVGSVKSVLEELEKEAPSKTRANPFDSMQIALADIIGIRFLPVADFSLIGLTVREEESKPLNM